MCSRGWCVHVDDQRSSRRSVRISAAPAPELTKGDADRGIKVAAISPLFVTLMVLSDRYGCFRPLPVPPEQLSQPFGLDPVGRVKMVALGEDLQVEVREEDP